MTGMVLLMIVQLSARTLEPTQAGGIPGDGCVGPIAREASIREINAVMPDGARARPRPQDAGWVPVELSDITEVGDRFAVVDAGVPALTLLDAGLRRLWSIERRGNGPGELQVPRKVRVDPRGDTLWVLDEGRHALMSFTTDGRPQRTIPVPSDVIDFDVTRKGELLVSHLVLPSRVTSSAVVLSRVGANGTLVPLVSHSRQAVQPPQFVLPGPNRPTVRVLGDLVAVVYPAAGVVDLYRPSDARGYQHLRTIAACMPDGLRRAYAAQLAERRNPQTAVDLISDVARRGDTLFVAGTRPDANRRYGIQRFLLSTGGNAGAIVFPGDRRVLPGDFRFRSGPSFTFMAFDSFAGYVALLEVTERGAPR